MHGHARIRARARVFVYVCMRVYMCMYMHMWHASAPCVHTHSAPRAGLSVKSTVDDAHTHIHRGPHGRVLDTVDSAAAGANITFLAVRTLHVALNCSF